MRLHLKNLKLPALTRWNNNKGIIFFFFRFYNYNYINLTISFCHSSAKNYKKMYKIPIIFS